MAGLLIKTLALSGCFILALVYDGYFISLFFLMCGLLFGFDLGNIIKKGGIP